MEEVKKNIAMLIDADNAPAKKIDIILSDIAQEGVVNIRKAYGNWKKDNLKGWEAILHQYAIQPIQQYDLTEGKNASDIALTIDAMDIVYTRQVDAFCIVSSDCDFTPLVMRILAEGKAVFGFGERKTPLPFVVACSRFLYLDDEDKNENKQGAKKTRSELKQDTKLIGLLRNAIDVKQDDSGWTLLSSIGSVISNQTSFDPRNYGYKKLGDLIKEIDIFETKKNEAKVLVVRDKKKKKSENS